MEKLAIRRNRLVGMRYKAIVRPSEKKKTCLRGSQEVCEKIDGRGG